MDETAPPRTAGVKRGRPVSTVVATPSPSRRRRRRVGSSPGCVPRTNSSTTPTRTLLTTSATTTPPPRRLLPPTQSSASRTGRVRSAPVLRLDDADADDAMNDVDLDGASTGDDALSIISGDGSPERDRHVLEFLTLTDGTPAFSLFTPPPSITKTSGVVRSIKRELIGGAFTPQASPSPQRSRSSSTNTSPSRFLRSPYANNSSRKTNSTPSTPTRLSDGHQQASRFLSSPRTPPFPMKTEPMEDAIAFSVRSTPTSAGCWRKNSLSLVRTPSHTASARTRMLRAKARAAQLAKTAFGSSSDEETASESRKRRRKRLDANTDFDSDDDYTPSSHRGGQDQDWFFSFANTLSPLGPGGAGTAEDDLENSLVSLRFSPVAPSACIDLHRLLPPFPSPPLGPTASASPTPKTPTPTTGHKATTTTTTTNGSSSCSSSSSSSVSTGHELIESFPNIRASTSATPGRDERLKLSSVMSMKLHVTFDDVPPSHTKREIEAINNSLKRRKHTRKRKTSEDKQRTTKANGKASVQRKLLETPVKADSPAKASSVVTKPAKARSAQRQLLVGSDDNENDSDSVKSGASSSSTDSAASASSSQNDGTMNDSEKENAKPSWRRRLSPVFSTLSTPTLPFNKSTTPTLHALKLRKPAITKASASQGVEEKPSQKPSQKPRKQNAVVATVETAKPTRSPAKTAASSAKPKSAAVLPAASQPSYSAASLAASPVIKTETKTSVALMIATPVAVAKSISILTTPKPLLTPSGAQLTTPIAATTTAADTASTTKKKAPCNCKKSKCLKLYCECFASGGYCDESCNCVDCANTPADEELRQKAIASRLEKNPNAFKPKIEPALTPVALVHPGFSTPLAHLHHHVHAHASGHLHHHHHPHLHPATQLHPGGSDIKKMHKHGCHCKKSACQKRYCECFQAGVPCGDNCRCIDCKNQSPYVAKHHLTGLNATPNSFAATRGSGIGAHGLTAATQAAAAATGSAQDTGDEHFLSPPLPSIRQRLRIDRETWARNFNSPFEVSPRRERERTERFRAQQKNSRAAALLRSISSATSGVRIKTEPSTTAASSLAFASPPGASLLSASSRSLSPLSDATRPPPAPTPQGKDKDRLFALRPLPRNAHVLGALASAHETPGRVYVLPLFGDKLPPVKSEVSAAIFRFLTNADVYNASLVNRLWSRVTLGETVWDHATFRQAVDADVDINGDQTMAA